MINPRALRCQDCGGTPDLVLTSEQFARTVAFCVACATGRVLLTVHLQYDIPVPQR